jgi:hypothetical protein
MHKFNENNFEATAKAVIRFNKHYQGRTVDVVMRQMKDMARDMEREGSVFRGTVGYTITAYKIHNTDTTEFFATVSAHILDLQKIPCSVTLQKMYPVEWQGFIDDDTPFVNLLYGRWRLSFSYAYWRRR